MSLPEGYVRQIKSLDEALHRHNEQTKNIREQRNKAKERLYKWMKSHNLEEYQGYKLNKLAPRPKVPRKKTREKKEDALRLFTNIGVDDPEELWVAFQRTQKLMVEEADQ
jgi:hypothetical protein